MDAELLCTRCRNKARKDAVVYLVADAKSVHTAIRQAPRGGVPQVCGGVVVPVGEEWLARIVPGGVVRAHRPADPALHRVRLGKRVAVRGACGEWEGTSLCGASGEAWDPSVEATRALDGPRCLTCGP